MPLLCLCRHCWEVPAALRAPPADPASPGASRGITLSQLDFAASLAALLGTPVPFSNIGRASAELHALAMQPLQGVRNVAAWLASYAAVLEENAGQVHNGRCLPCPDVLLVRVPWAPCRGEAAVCNASCRPAMIAMLRGCCASEGLLCK